MQQEYWVMLSDLEKIYKKKKLELFTKLKPFRKRFNKNVFELEKWA